MREILLYLSIGLVWTLYFNYITVKYVKGEFAGELSGIEKIIHTVFWPVFVGLYIVELIKAIFGKD